MKKIFIIMTLALVPSMSYACEHQEFKADDSEETVKEKVHSKDDSCDMDTESYEIPKIKIDEEDF